MGQTRRIVILQIMKTFGLAPLVMAPFSRSVYACLYGTWKVRCPYDRQVDVVMDGTCQHVCSKDHQQVFIADEVTVVCPVGHDNRIHTGRLTTSWKCTTSGCGLECRVDSTIPVPPSRPDTPDHH